MGALMGEVQMLRKVVGVVVEEEPLQQPVEVALPALVQQQEYLSLQHLRESTKNTFHMICNNFEIFFVNYLQFFLPVILILNNCWPVLTVAPSSTKCSSIIPSPGEGTGIDV